ncbi:hypothetical protein [Mycolicibacterium komossense]|uniref:Uncharacterized protein n=1 Tax=Mycolicibacterium komossense TaxID=1779 RepID=A0ABT3CMB8_9MYCO|nr:hypothetical protein [Mycolicibacterium komossense]MCV7230693.1 hypothetical protein [Mycolicibacterium komossense]
MNAAEVLAALRSHHNTSALIPEVVIQDDYPVWAELENGHGKPYTRRIDALMFDAGSNQRTAIEIKVSRSDVQRETWNKVQPWRRVVHRFIYAVPAGLIERPPIYGCGLWWVHDPDPPYYPCGRVEVRKKAVIQRFPEPLPQHVIRSLAFRAAGVPLVTNDDVQGGV